MPTEEMQVLHRWFNVLVSFCAVILIAVCSNIIITTNRMEAVEQRMETEAHKATQMYAELCECVELTEKEMVFLSKANGHYFVWWLGQEEKYSDEVQGKRFTVWFDSKGTESQVDDVILDFAIVE